MRKINSLWLGCALIAAPTGVATAADFEPYKPAVPVVEVPAPAPVPLYDAWYLRGFVGMSNQRADTFTSADMAAGDFTVIDKSFGSAPFMGLALGYETGHGLRVDASGEYRGKSKFRGLDVNNEFDYTNDTSGFKSEWLFLANAYWDFGTWHGLTPYVGVGGGVARVTLHDFWDVNVPNGGVWWADDKSRWNWAWALHAGLAFDITKDVTFDLAYRYVNMGDGKTGLYYTFDSNATGEPHTVKDIDSHDLMLGVRWRFGHDGGSSPYKY